MPIYEYLCDGCGRVTSAIIMKPREEEGLRCQHCGAAELVRIISRCTFHKTETQRLNEFDTQAPRDDAFYKDSRNIGLWAKKRAKEKKDDSGGGGSPQVR